MLFHKMAPAPHNVGNMLHPFDEHLLSHSTPYSTLNSEVEKVDLMTAPVFVDHTKDNLYVFFPKNGASYPVSQKCSLARPINKQFRILWQNLS